MVQNDWVWCSCNMPFVVVKAKTGNNFFMDVSLKIVSEFYLQKYC